MNLTFYNCPEPKGSDDKVLPQERPGFLGYRPDFLAMYDLVKNYKDFVNVLLIGQGGSVSSFAAMYGALESVASRKAYILSTTDPDYIIQLQKTLTPKNTLVLAISKSGETITQLEALSQFFGYQTLVITERGSSLDQMSEKLNWPSVRHPQIGDRFSGLTEMGLLPLLLCGLPAEAVYLGAKAFYKQYAEDNLAYRAASVLWQLESLQNKTEVFGLVYSHYLSCVSLLAIQLCHESFCKDGKGQSFIFAEGPEVQHHTLQRILGGRQNLALWFFSVHSFMQESVATYPPQIHGVSVRDYSTFDLNKIPLSFSMQAEMLASLESARLAGLPVMHLELPGLDATCLGQMIAFWQLFAVYSAGLRGVEPFDQPAVETSKRLSLTKRLAYKGLL